MLNQRTELNRLAAFDYIRVTAMLGILVCHSCYVSSLVPIPGIGRYLGSTFNFLFLILSAFLLGASWANKNFPKLGFKYVGKRIVKLSKSYYPYLVVLFLFLYVSQDYFSWRNIVTHALYLPWFDKIDGFGHLWFLTMIILCYFAIWILSFFSANKRHRHNTIAVCCLTMGGGIVIDYLATNLGLPGYIFPYIIGYLIVYRYANNLLAYFKKIPMSINILQFCIINSVAIFLFADGLFESNVFASYLIGMASAISFFLLLYNVLKKVAQVKFIEWLSEISFEIYLVHEFFLGKYCVYGLFSNNFIGFLSLVVFSIIAACLIKYNFLNVYIFIHNKRLYNQVYKEI